MVLERPCECMRPGVSPCTSYWLRSPAGTHLICVPDLRASLWATRGGAPSALSLAGGTAGLSRTRSAWSGYPRPSHAA